MLGALADGERTVVDQNIGGIVTRRRVYDQTLIVSPSSGDFHRARWCAGEYAGAVLAGKRTIGTFSFRVTG